MWQCPRCGYCPELEKALKAHDAIRETIEDFKRVLESYEVEGEPTEVVQEGDRTAIVTVKKARNKKRNQ